MPLGILPNFGDSYLEISVVDLAGNQGAGIEIEIFVNSTRAGTAILGPTGEAFVEARDPNAIFAAAALGPTFNVGSGPVPRGQHTVTIVVPFIPAQTRQREARCPGGKPTGIPCVICNVQDRAVRICV